MRAVEQRGHGVVDVRARARLRDSRVRMTQVRVSITNVSKVVYPWPLGRVNTRRGPCWYLSGKGCVRSDDRDMSVCAAFVHLWEHADAVADNAGGGRAGVYDNSDG